MSSADGAAVAPRPGPSGALVRHVVSLIFLLGALSAAAAVPAATASTECDSLARAAVAGATLESVTRVETGTLAAAGANLDGLPAFCRIVGVARPTAQSRIGFEVWLPLHGWNGKYAQAGNGGLGGVIAYPLLAELLKRGYATAATDNGHREGPLSGAWAMGHPERVHDFGYRAVNETRRIGAELARRAYGIVPRRNYFHGCSAGGREAMVQAERFPQHFDGIVAGAPASDWVATLSGFAWAAQALHAAPDTFIPTSLLAKIQVAAVQQCDARDGLVDGIVDDPTTCTYEPDALRCAPGADGTDCLTARQLGALRRLYGGLVDPVSGRVLAPGYPPTGEAETSARGGGVRSYQFGEAPGMSLGARFANAFFGGLVFEDATWDYRRFDPARDVEHARRKLGAVLDAHTGDLRAFRANGGKLIQYHGTLDGSIPVQSSLSYFERATALAGGARALARFHRLYVVPGMLHCGYGPGANAFGNQGVPSPRGPETDVLDALDRWVEHGIAPDRLIATKYRADDPLAGIEFQRPLCPHPARARWDGRGDVKSATSFRCERSMRTGTR